MGFLPNCSHIRTTVWLLYWNSNETHGDKARWELCKNAACCFEKSRKQHSTKQQLTAACHPFNLDKQDMLGNAGKVRDKVINKIFMWTPTYGNTSVGRPAKTYILQLCGDTGYSLEDLPREMTNRDWWRERERERERERVKGIHAIHMTWWWWWWFPINKYAFPIFYQDFLLDQRYQEHCAIKMVINRYCCIVEKDNNTDV